MDRKNPTSYPDRIKTLQDISGLDVGHHIDKGQSVYEFKYNGKVVKTCFTYPKAKLFAQGIQFGRQLKRKLDDEDVIAASTACATCGCIGCDGSCEDFRPD